MLENPTLYIGGKRWTGWKEVVVTRALSDASAAFALKLLYKDPDSAAILKIQPDLNCQLFTRPDKAQERDNELLITGYTTEDEGDETGTELSLTLDGKSNTHDLVKNSVQHATGRLVKMTVLQIAQALALPYGVTVTSTVVDNYKLDVFRLEPGEKVYEAIERAARMRGMLVTDNESGQLVLCRAGTLRNDPITYGDDFVKTWNHKRSSDDRYTTYRVVGQKGGNNNSYGAAVAGCKGYVEDKGWTTRAHILTLMAEGEADNKACQERAAWEAAVRAGKSSVLTVTTHGWRGPSGRLWKINELTRVKYPRRGIDRDLLISAVEYSIGESGTAAKLTLSIPSAFAPEPVLLKNRKKSGDWNEDWSDD